MKRLFPLFLWGTVLGGLVLGGVFYWHWRILKNYLNQFKWDQSIQIYSRPLTLSSESYVMRSFDFLKSELMAYGYQGISEQDQPRPHTFWKKEDTLCIFPAKTKLSSDFLSIADTPVCVSRDTESLSPIHLPPILIGYLFAKEHQYDVRSVTRLEDIPPELMWSVIVIEDERFFEHGGVDLKSIARAFWANLRSGKIVQGGSTITQQLIKNMLLTQEKTLWRKIREALLAYLVEVAVSKDEILTTYLNEIYFGVRGASSIYGVKEAAEYYFGKPLIELNLSECAILAAMIKNPGRFSQDKHRQELAQRRNLVLDHLQEGGYATQTEVASAKAHPVVLKKINHTDRRLYGYVLDAIRFETLGKVTFFQDKNVIVSTIDPLIQHLLMQTSQFVLSGMRTWPAYSNNREQALQGAMVVTSPKTGEILALQGGFDYIQTPYNRVLEAKRQVGSTIKPFVYAAALELDLDLSPSTLILDEPTEFQARPDEVWIPRNYEDKYVGWVTLRQALENSINVATIKLAYHVGLSRLQPIFTQLWPRLTTFYPSSVVGSMDLTMRELLERYQIFYGCQNKSMFGFHMMLGQPRDVFKNPLGCDALAHVASMLNGVIQRGTAQYLKTYVPEYSDQLMGKTGTTNDGHDSWFVGMDRHFLAAGWVGFDQPEKSDLSGAGGALLLYGEWMKQMIRTGYIPERLEVPHSGAEADGAEEIRIE